MIIIFSKKLSNISLTEIKEARERIRKVINKTPCIYSLPLSRKVGKEVFLKLENLQVTQTFKARGNANKIALLNSKERKKGVITASSGNHGLGLSLATLRNDVKAVIVLPEVAPSNKIEKIKENKVEVVIKGKTYEDAASYAHSVAEEKGYIYIPSFDDPDIIKGNGSIGLEILEEVPESQVIICPIGGGGGISGISLAAKQIKSDIQIIGVEADLSASMLESVKVNRIVELPPADTFADGIAIRKPGKLNFEIVRRYVDEIVTVSEKEMRLTIPILAIEAKIVAEGAGAASVAALLFGKFTTKRRKIVCIVTGGNIDTSLFCELMLEFKRGVKQYNVK